MKTKNHLIYILFISSMFDNFLLAAQSKKEIELYNFSKPDFSGNGFSDHIYHQMNIRSHDVDNLKETCSIRFTLNKNNEMVDFRIWDSTSNKNFNELFYKALSESSKEWKVAKINNKPVDITIVASAAKSVVYDPQGKGFLVAGFWYLLNDSLADKFYNEGVTLSSNNEFTEAIKYFDQVLKIATEDIDALYSRGICKYKSDDKAGACEDWKKIQSLDRKDADKLILKYCGN